MKHRLVFNIGDAEEIAASDQVGAVVQGIRAGAKQQINSQSVNSEEWLNTASILYDDAGAAINDANPLPVDLVSPLTVDVDLDGDYDAGTNATPDSVGLIAHDRAAAPDETNQNQRPTAGGWADILTGDIANVHALDTNAFLMGLNDSSGDAERLEIDDATQGLKVFIAGSDPLTVNDAALAETAIANAANSLAVADTAQDVVASPLANRKYLWVSNVDNKDVFIGASGVTAANGFPLPPGSYMQLRAGAAVDIEFVGQSGDQPAIRTLELS